MRCHVIVRDHVTTELVSLRGLKNRHGHLLCWMSTGRKNGLMRTTHILHTLNATGTTYEHKETKKKRKKNEKKGEKCRAYISMNNKFFNHHVLLPLYTSDILQLLLIIAYLVFYLSVPSSLINSRTTIFIFILLFLLPSHNVQHDLQH